jgi:hypothetical protein
VVSNFQVEYGREEDGNAAALLRVPVRYGDASRQAQTILQENSRNSMPATPMMTFYIAALNYDRPRMQEPYHVSKVSVRQRTYDPATETYETTQGNAFTIERLMPVPYQLTINLDIWTSNTNQKLQLLEQMLTLFNPSLEIQSTDNFIDWTSLTVLELESVTWSSRTIPIGTENPIDIATVRFNIPIWLSPPAKVKKLGVVERIIANLYDAQGDLNEAVSDNDLLLGTRMIFTPFNYGVVVIGDRIQCVESQDLSQEPSNDSLSPPVALLTSPLHWPAVIGMYGVLRPGISQIRLEQPDGTEVIGTIVVDPTDDNFVIFTPDIDTIPPNTLPPLDAVVDPLATGPGTGLPPAANGQRYLLTDATGDFDNVSNPVAWRGSNGRPLVAKTNDIIEYSDAYGYWRVMFHADQETATQYVTNITTGIQYRWTGDSWVKSYQGIYAGGQWRLVL